MSDATTSPADRARPGARRTGANHAEAGEGPAEEGRAVEEDRVGDSVDRPGISGNLQPGGRAQPADALGAGSRPGDSAGSMTRSEEQLRLGVRIQPLERVRLVKYIVTENVTFTVPVQREELRIERIPLEPDNAGEGPSEDGEVGQRPFDQDPVEVVLHEERVSWTTDLVPVELVRLDIHTHITQAEVSAGLRAEKIELTQDRPALVETSHDQTLP